MPAANASEVAAAARALIERCGFGAVLALLGRDGMMLVEPRGVAAIGAAAAGDNYDAGGAEDTALAAVAAALGAGLPLAIAAQLAGIAVGIVTGKAGTAVASAGELAAALAIAARSKPAQPVMRIEVAP
jgi:D-beta-D-heptose 7-phosphate kinase/D-beta-D-heptose 1-phosphate adenosyltransferase